MSIQQIEQYCGYSTLYTYKKLRRMRMNGWIIGETIHGNYKHGVRYQGKYFRISVPGIKILQEKGLPISHLAHHLKVNHIRVPYLLMTNDLFVDLARYGWSLVDSRDTKKRFQLNRKDGIQGLLKHEVTKIEYGIYVFLKGSTYKTIEGAIQEIHKYSYISDFMLFTRGSETFNKLASRLLENDNGNTVAKKSSIKLFPHTFGRQYLRHFWDEEQVLSYVERTYGIRRIEQMDRSEAAWDGMTTIVEYMDEEMYFINLMDSDLKKIFEIRQYRQEKYEKDGRKVLVLSQIPNHKEWLSEVHHVEYLTVDHRALASYMAEESKERQE